MSLFNRRLVMVAAAGAAALALSACSGGGAAGSAEGDMALGSADAPVTVVEYASVTCGHCATWNEQVWPEFKARWVDTGQVRYVFRELPTPPIDVAVAGFLTARCAGEDRYFQVVDAIMRAQPEIFAGNARGALVRIARSAGLTEAQFEQCVSDEAAIAAMNERIEAAQAAGVTGTPYFLIDGEPYTGDTSLAGFEQALAPHLGDAAAADPEPAG